MPRKQPVFLSLALLFGLQPRPANALAAEKTIVYCADRRIEITTWDLEQMKVRRGSNVCTLSSFSPSSSAQSFAQKNFGGSGKTFTCQTCTCALGVFPESFTNAGPNAGPKIPASAPLPAWR